MTEKVLFSEPFTTDVGDSRLLRRNFYSELSGFGTIDTDEAEVVRVQFEDLLPSVVFNPSEEKLDPPEAEIRHSDMASVLTLNAIQMAHMAIIEGRAQTETVVL